MNSATYIHTYLKEQPDILFENRDVLASSSPAGLVILTQPACSSSTAKTCPRGRCRIFCRIHSQILGFTCCIVQLTGNSYQKWNWLHTLKLRCRWLKDDMCKCNIWKMKVPLLQMDSGCWAAPCIQQHLLNWQSSKCPWHPQEACWKMAHLCGQKGTS